jgi:putative FmdB family regulatory protein
MPTYEYACRSCNAVIEVFQSMRDAPVEVCPRCGKPGLKRLIGRGAGIIFKGSGFYETDYKRSAARAGSKEDSDKKPAKESTTSASPTPAPTAINPPASSSGGNSSRDGST